MPPITSTTVDLSRYPFPLLDSQPGETFSTGDLHGNTLTFIHLLLKYQIAKPIDATTQEKDYQKLVAAYNIDWTHASRAEKEKAIQTVNDYLNGLTFNTDIPLRLIGDVLADRGRCDYLTLLVMEKLHENNVPFEILYSNHDDVFANKIENLQPMQIFNREERKPIEKLDAFIDQKTQALQETCEALCSLLDLIEQMKHSPPVGAIQNIRAKVRAFLNTDLMTTAWKTLDRASEEWQNIKILIQFSQNPYPSNYNLSQLNISLSLDKILPVLLNISMGQADVATQYISMATAQQLIDENIVPQEKYEELFTKYYRPHLKLLSSSLSPDQSSLSIFTHAPVGLETIREIATYFHVSYKDQTTLELHETIQAINQEFLKYVELGGKISDLTKPQPDRLSNPFYRLIWNRTEDGLERSTKLANGESVGWINGHTGEGEPTSIDNALGRDPGWPFILQLPQIRKTLCAKHPDHAKTLQSIFSQTISNYQEINANKNHPFVCQAEAPSCAPCKNPSSHGP